MTTFDTGRGVYQPEDLSAMREVFEEVTSEPWFDRRPEARNSFAKYLLENYPDGSYDPIKHRAVIEDAARKYFSGLPAGIDAPPESASSDQPQGHGPSVSLQVLKACSVSA